MKDFIRDILIAEQLFQSLADEHPADFPRLCDACSKNKFQSFEGNVLLSPARSASLLYPHIFLVPDNSVFSLSPSL